MKQFIDGEFVDSVGGTRPVAVIMAYDGLDPGIALANDAPYGLCATFSAGDPAEEIAVARRLDAGTVTISQWLPSGIGFIEDWIPAACVGAPLGGHKHSGTGREGGLYGFREFLETKAITP